MSNWLRLNRTSGSGDGNIIVTASSYSGDTARSTRVKVYNEQYGLTAFTEVVQHEYTEPTGITADPKVFNFDPSGEILQLHINASAPWYFADPWANWVGVGGGYTTGGTAGQHTIPLITTKNMTGEVLDDIISIKCGNEIIYLRVRQEEYVPEPDKTWVRIFPTTLDVPQEGGEYTIDVTSNGDWVVNAPDWIELSTIGGTGNGTVTVRIPENVSYYDLIGDIIFSTVDESKTVNVIQDHSALPTISVNPTSKLVKAAGDSYRIRVSADTEWVVASCPNWITYIVEDNVVTITTTDNGSTRRSGDIVFRLKGFDVTARTEIIQRQAYTPPTPTGDYVTFEAMVDGSSIEFLENVTTDYWHVQYKVNEGTWVNAATGIIVSLNLGDKMYLRADSRNVSGIQVELNGDVIVYGDIRNLIDYTDKSTSWSTYAFWGLFYGDGLTDASGLIFPTTTTANCYESMFAECTNLMEAPVLPATRIAENAYNSMFYGCTSLTEAPELPATELSNRGGNYSHMFEGCTSLVYTPELPATTLTPSCYDSMFRDCTSLVNAPELPATILVEGCYSGMFYGCTSLINTPELPVTTLARSCYSSMFANCTSLVTAPELPATMLGYKPFSGDYIGENCYESMFKGCTSLVNAPKLPATTLTPSCYDSMFRDCTSLTEAPELPATVLQKNCYDSMFYGCTSLTEAPELPATTLVESCYAFMFMHSSNLNKIKILATDVRATNCLRLWTSDVSPTGTFIKKSGVNYPTGENGIPNGWTVQNI